MIDLYACVECGRCTNMCPATGTGKMLSPMDLITKLRDNLTNHRCACDEAKTLGANICFPSTKGNQLHWLQEQKAQQWKIFIVRHLIGDVITEEEIWACTTCRNCEDQCPVMNEHVDKIIDLRRYLSNDRRENESGCTTRDDKHRTSRKSMGP